ncbi:MULTISPECIES: indolepyruvate ferredoxin oxidoreductase family protein [unclassified Nocardioides]|uniref:indolepyruvate ferredoxin oxidoreductase family protein n=1 Tax=unclassified Nocardioides TaxID=2615069 RepID=UPI0006FF805C|nr:MULTISPECIES: indolepyruvate ferredoxin oxidoreductase family protein [unclassified Nocardioides]KRA30953.1 indolepyruvate ferredoxin oxidoreductase [Nocardioides sp. Root614]KRA87574.1 indolepyruvate ferredoxin oxidoreductase [Nocardioides sp. Root682]
MTALIDGPVAEPAVPTPYDLDDRFRPSAPPVLLTGVQAIARLLVEHRALDRRRGLHTASFVSGYQGSPLGGLDKMLGDMQDVLDENDIRFVPGLNEELAATAVWGSQVDLPAAKATHDGVTGFWYGKGPGVDRATDALRHLNMYGVNRYGGAVLLVGDDPASKSSTVPAVSERSLAALGIPVLFPRNSSEIVTLGLHAVEMSRASGCVVAIKIVADVADGAWVVDSADLDLSPVVPAIEWNGHPYVYTQSPMVLRPAMIVGAEAELVGPRAEVVRAYAGANGLDVMDVDVAGATTGFVASGSCYDSMRQAMTDLGITDEALAAAGIRVLRLGMMSPVAPSIIRTFAEGLDRIVVIEDKTSFIEAQVRDILYGTPAAPEVLGKRDSNGMTLVPADGELTSGRLLAPMRHLLQGVVELKVPAAKRTPLPLLSAGRGAYFCSGCPHNRSTVLPEGSMGGGGIGCHAMVTISDRPESAVTGVTQMGGEGAQWIGQAWFTDAPHIFQNVGDGTFFHSAQLAVQACIAAGVNITYKVLYNDVVAMTGAQDAEGALSVPLLSHKLHTEGVKKIIICADEPERHRKRDLAPGTLLWDRDRLDEAQRMLRDIPGVTVLIYDQHCAADARRQRKRGSLPTRTKRVVINEAVCEGCGDCGVKSNCLSVQPVETEYGRKTRIEQTSCNTDYSCLDGDCPSFVTVETAPRTRRTLRKAKREAAKAAKPTKRRTYPTPPVVAASPAEDRVTTTQNVFMAGIGGTGIVTVNQVLATAALRAGYAVESLDQTGLSQKAGPVTGHLRFAEGDLEPANRLTPGSADCLLGFDLLTLAEDRNLVFGDATATRTVVSTSRTATGAMVQDLTVQHPDEADLLKRVRTASVELFDFDGLEAADRIFGNTVAANFLLVGAAYQTGALRLPAAAIEEAIGINGTAVAANVAAFRWGRVAVADPAAFRAANEKSVAPRERHVPASVAASGLDGELLRLVAQRAADLVDYQDEKLADSYVDLVAGVAAAERSVTTKTRFSEAVARHLFKLTAYKDEYEVARLLTDPAFLADTGAEFPGGTVAFQLHPPALRALGRKKKIAFGPRSHGSLRALARMKVLRGTAADPFGRAHLRKVERELRDHYRTLVTDLAGELSTEGYDRAVQIAELPDVVRGYEGVKLRNVERYVAELEALGATVPAITV